MLREIPIDSCAIKNVEVHYPSGNWTKTMLYFVHWN